MKTISGKVASSRPISLSKASKFLTTFVLADTEASQAVSAFLRRTSAEFNELTQLHRQLRGSESERKHKKHRSQTLNCVDLYKAVAEEEGARDPGTASVTNPVVDLGGENNFEFAESGSVRKKGKKKHKRNEGGEFAEEKGSRDPGTTSDTTPNANSDRVSNFGSGESGSVKKKGKKRNEGGESGDFSEKHGEIEEGEGSVGIDVGKRKNEAEKSSYFDEISGEIKDGKMEGEESVGIEMGKKKMKKNEGEKSSNFGEIYGEIKDGKMEGEETVGIEVGKSKKRKISEAEGVGNDVSEDRHSSKKKKSRKGERED